MKVHSSKGSFASYTSEKHPVAKFPLGGIGTGNISLGTRGQLCDWEIFNRPGIGQTMPYTFFGISFKSENGERINRVLEANHIPPFDLSGGYASADLAGLPRFRSAEMRSMYPFVWVDLIDDSLPFEVKLEAFTPFVPLDDNASSIPAAIFRYSVTNLSQEPASVSIAGSMTNSSGFTKLDSMGEVLCEGSPVNTIRRTKHRQGIYFHNEDLDSQSMHYGTLSLTTKESDASFKPTWFEGQWTDLAQEFWRDFSEDGRLDAASSVDGVRCILGERGNYGYIRRKEVVGSVAGHNVIGPYESHTFEFLLTWSFPNRLGTWLELDEQRSELLDAGDSLPKARNHYSLRYPDAWDVVQYLEAEIGDLERRSVAFRDALYSTTIPVDAIEVVANNIATLRSQTCYRTADGKFYGYEGVTSTYGTGAGNVTHVWNYAQTLAYLFPNLELSMRKMEANRTHENGFMSFRHLDTYQGLPWDMPICVDGQLGSIIRVYREWVLTGSIEILEELWPAYSKALDYVLKEYFSENVGLLTGVLHNTYDIEFIGANPMSNILLLGALRCAEQISNIKRDMKAAEKYTHYFKHARRGVLETLWNGEYFEQDYLEESSRPYQMGRGCLSDQMLGQWLTSLVNLPDILPKNVIQKTLDSIYDNNFKEVADIVHVQRAYAMPGEMGVLNCSWPRGERPDYPFAFCDEVWTGTEYAVASQMITEGRLENAMEVVRATRERYDGAKRNPWAEIEAGWHYTRAMSSWGLLLACSGFECSVPMKSIAFSPISFETQFKTFWSCGAGWGVYLEQAPEDGISHWSLSVIEGDLEGFIINGDSVVQNGHAHGTKIVA